MASSKFLGSILHKFPHPNNTLLHHHLHDQASQAHDEGEMFFHVDGPMRNLSRFVQRLDREGRDMFEKMLSEIENEVPVEQLLREAMHECGGGFELNNVLEKLKTKLNDHITMSKVEDRGVDVDLGETKLERFKVKTLNIVTLQPGEKQ